MKTSASVFAVALSLCAAGTALSQSYPAKAVRVIVQFTPGGTPDTYNVINTSGSSLTFSLGNSSPASKSSA